MDLKTHLQKKNPPFGKMEKNGEKGLQMELDWRKITSDGIEENSGSLRFLSQNSHSQEFLCAKMSNCM